ncbi:MAG TPA: condensation domain-containing protein, partial [Streptosporangiaceae bacterium]|nr:condensation domain-containing protein [Streptosporangiaceae bacterium]
VGDVVERHESLRTIFPDTLGVPRQQILEAGAARPRLAVVPVTAADLSEALASAARHGFDLATQPPLRVHLFALGAGEHVLLLLLHHIAGDGWSMAPLMRDLARAYAARCRGRPPELPVLPVQYADYTLWQQQALGSESDSDSAIARQLAFWTATLDHLPDQIDLPTDRPRPVVASYRGDNVPLRLSPDLHRRLLALARDSQASLFMVLQAGLAALLTRLGAGTDIPIGSPVAGRSDSALDDLVGFFVNTLVLRTDTAGQPGFRELIARVRAANLAAYTHQELPFERLVEILNPVRSLSRHPLFQVMLAFQNDPDVSPELPGLSTRFEAVDTATAKFDLSLGLNEQRAPDGTPQGIEGVFEYSTELFDRGSVEAMAGRLVRLLEAAVADPDQPIGRLDILTPEERRTILEEWNDTARSIPASTLPELFEAQAARTPQAVAVVFEERRLTYAELNARANQLAHHLQGLGVGPETVVGLCVERSLEMVVGLMGILKAGAAYLPLDPGYPPERLAYMLGDARAPVLLTHAALLDRLPEHHAQVICLDADWEEISLHSLTAPAHVATSNNLAYVIYTSGSTGQPKGVGVLHCNIVRLVQNANFVDLTPNDVFLHLAPLAFDASTFEIWGALLNGAKLVIYPDVDIELLRLKRIIEDAAVSVVWLTAGLFHRVVDEDLSTLLPVRKLLAGGDVLSTAHVLQAIGGLPDCQLINGYGPTESTTFSACFSVPNWAEFDTSVPLGHPIS